MSFRPTLDDARDLVRRDESARGGARPSAPWLALRLRSRRAPLTTAAIVLLGSLPLCFLCGLLLDVPLARAALGAPQDLRAVAEVFSDLGLSGYMLILSGLTAAAAYLAQRRGYLAQSRTLVELVAERALFVFTAVAASGIAVQVIKHVVGRARPRLIDQLGAFHFDHFSLKASLASFPSGHSTSIFALAAALGLIAPRLRPVAFGLAALVGLARVALAAHYASDILAGATFGVAVTFGVASFFADRSIAFTRARGTLRLKGRGVISSAWRGHRPCARAGG